MNARLIITVLIFLVTVRFTEELTWNTKMRAFVCCQGNEQLLIWNFTAGEYERVTELHWFFNKKTLVCFVSNSTGFVVADLYEGRVKRNGTAGILLKNLSLNDAGEYTLYVKLEEEKERNVQGINLTVIEPPPSQCKPIIKIEHPKGIISCSTSCERSPLSLEWIINGTKETWGIGPYFVVNSSGTSEQPICCLRDFECCNDYQTKFCMRNNISFTEDMQTDADTNCMVYRPILINLIVAVIVLITVVIALCAILNRGRCKLFRKRLYAITDDIKIELEEEPMSEKMSAVMNEFRMLEAKFQFLKEQVETVMFSNDQETHADCDVIGPEETDLIIFQEDHQPHVDVNDVQVPEESVPMLANGQKPHADDNDVQVPEDIVSILNYGQKPHADDNDVQVPEESVPMLANGQKPDANDNDVLVPEDIVSMLTYGQKPHADDNDVQVPEPNADINHVQVPEETVTMLTSDQKQQADDNDVQVPEKMSSIMLKRLEELDAKGQRIREQDWPLQDTNQRVQIVNNVCIDTDLFKCILHSNTALMAELQTRRKGARKLKKHLHRKTHLRKKENRDKYSYEMATVKRSDFKNNETDRFERFESQDASSDDTDRFERFESQDASSGDTDTSDTSESEDAFSAYFSEQ